MFKKTAILFSLAILPLTASANWTAGGGYAKVSADDISLGAIYGSIAYTYKATNNFFIVPELRLGTGVSDDTIYDVKVEIESFTTLSVRGQYDYASGAYLFAMPSYANLDVKASYQGLSETEDDWELGYGIGAGFKISNEASIEASFEKYDDVDVATIGLKYTF
jgi:hypothetical protein